MTDVVLHPINGVELARRLRKVLPELKVLYVSGYDATAAGLALGADGPDAFLGKPFTARELEARLRELLPGSTGDSLPVSSGVTPRDGLK